MPNTTANRIIIIAFLLSRKSDRIKFNEMTLQKSAHVSFQRFRSNRDNKFKSMDGQRHFLLIARGFAVCIYIFAMVNNKWVDGNSSAYIQRVSITKLPNLVQIIYSKKISSEKYMALDMIMEVKIDSGEVGGLNGQYMGREIVRGNQRLERCGKELPSYDARLLLLLQQPNREECLERTKTQVKQGQVKDWRESKETDREAGRQAGRQTDRHRQTNE